MVRREVYSDNSNNGRFICCEVGYLSRYSGSISPFPPFHPHLANMCATWICSPDPCILISSYDKPSPDDGQVLSWTARLSICSTLQILLKLTMLQLSNDCANELKRSQILCRLKQYTKGDDLDIIRDASLTLAFEEAKSKSRYCICSRASKQGHPSTPCKVQIASTVNVRLDDAEFYRAS